MSIVIFHCWHLTYISVSADFKDKRYNAELWLVDCCNTLLWLVDNQGWGVRLLCQVGVDIDNGCGHHQDHDTVSILLCHSNKQEILLLQGKQSNNKLWRHLTVSNMIYDIDYLFELFDCYNHRIVTRYANIVSINSSLSQSRMEARKTRGRNAPRHLWI